MLRCWVVKGIVIVQTEQIKSGDSETDGTRRMPGREGGGEGRAGMVEGGEGPTLSPTLWRKARPCERSSRVSGNVGRPVTPCHTFVLRCSSARSVCLTCFGCHPEHTMSATYP